MVNVYVYRLDSASWSTRMSVCDSRCFLPAPCPPPFLSIQDFWNHASKQNLARDHIADISTRCYGVAEPHIEASKYGGIVCGLTCIIIVLLAVGALFFLVLTVLAAKTLTKRGQRVKGEINGNGVRLNPLKERDNSRIIQAASEQELYMQATAVTSTTKPQGELQRSVSTGSGGFLNPMYSKVDENNCHIKTGGQSEENSASEHCENLKRNVEITETPVEKLGDKGKTELNKRNGHPSCLEKDEHFQSDGVKTSDINEEDNSNLCKVSDRITFFENKRL